MSGTTSAAYPSWDRVERKVKYHLKKICARLCPPETDLKTFRKGAANRAKETYERDRATANIYDAALSDLVWLRRFAIRSGLDERRWLVGRGDYTTCELTRYTSAYLMQSWDLKSDIEKAMLSHATQSDENCRSSKSIKLLYWDHYTEEQLCRFWYDDYAVKHRNNLKRLVRHDTEELRALLWEMEISPIKDKRGRMPGEEEASEVWKELSGEE